MFRVSRLSRSTIWLSALHSLVADYAGSASYASSSSPGQTLTVSRASTTTHLVASTTTPAVGQTVTYTATVAAVSPAMGSPGGTVNFLVGSTLLGAAAVTGGVASLDVVASGVGIAQTVDAEYVGTASYAASTSNGLPVNVQQGTPMLSLVATPDFVGKRARGATLTVTVHAGIPGGPVPTGTVTFDLNNKKLKTVSLAAGRATVVVASTKATGRTFVVHYAGDTNYAAGVSHSVKIAAKFFKAKSPVA